MGSDDDFGFGKKTEKEEKKEINFMDAFDGKGGFKR